MKKLTMAALVLGGYAGLAWGQTNATMYGILDVGIDYVNHANAAQGKVMRVTSGGQNTSRIGFKGTEDLGGGLKALFQLEGGVFLDSGASDGTLFKRQANVGLQGGFGTLIAGRSFTTTYDIVLPFDPMGYSPSYSWATSGNGTAASKYGMPTAFDNLVKYQGKFKQWTVGATLGFGEVAGTNADGRKFALGASYADGPFSAGLTWDQVNGNTVAATGRRNETTTWHLGAAWKMDKLHFKAGYRNYKLAPSAANTAETHADTYWAGVNYQAAKAVELTGAIYGQRVKNVAAGTEADPMLFVARLKYTLSPRTFLYASAGHAKAKNNQLVGLTRDASPEGVTGFADNQTGMIVGMQHRF